LFRESVSRAKFYGLAFDKGDKSKGKYGGCVKLLSHVDRYAKNASYPDSQIQIMTLDADKTGDDSSDVASGVTYSVKKLQLPAGTAGVAGTTDSGGGGTLMSVHTPLIESGVLMEDALLLNCTLHNLNLEGSVPFKKVLMGVNSGGGDKDKHTDRDVEQFLFSTKKLGKRCGMLFVTTLLMVCLLAMKKEKRKQHLNSSSLLPLSTVLMMMEVDTFPRREALILAGGRLARPLISSTNTPDSKSNGREFRQAQEERGHSRHMSNTAFILYGTGNHL